MATEEEKKAAQAQRDAIQVASVKKEEDVKEVEKEQEKAIEAKEAESKEEVKEEKETKEEIEENKEEIKESEKTKEELEADKEAAKTVAEKARIQRRIDKEVAKTKELARENAALKKQLEAKVEEGEVVLTEEEVERRSEIKAAEKQAQREFTTACNRLADEGNKIDKEFDDKIKSMADDIGLIPSQMIGILDDLEDDKGIRMGGKVLAYLANNVDDAERIYSLSPAKMAIELAKLSNKLVEKPKPKPISKVPEPNEGVGGNARIPTMTLTGKESMEDFVRIRAQQAEARRKQKMGIK
jgi:hypothetical protein